jgi:hypothetical protein
MGVENNFDGEDSWKMPHLDYEERDGRALLGYCLLTHRPIFKEKSTLYPYAS